jgi:hypothetical protein
VTAEQLIYVSAGGAVEYTFAATFTEVTGKNISADAVQASLGTYDAPGAWRTPDVTSTATVLAQVFAAANPSIPVPAAAGTTLYQVTFQILIGGTYKPAAGDYWLWADLTDTPELPVRRFPLKIGIR